MSSPRFSNNQSGYRSASPSRGRNLQQQNGMRYRSPSPNRNNNMNRGYGNQGGFSNYNMQRGYSNMHRGYGNTRNGTQGGDFADFGMYTSQGDSFSAGTSRLPSDPYLTNSQANVLVSLQATKPEVYNHVRGSSPGYLNEADVRRIAQALGIPTDGTRETIVSEIKETVGAMSPRSQQQFTGGLSPRTRQTFGAF